ncbi:MAG: hypothetical protein K0B81_06770 [Candidatus Cloacimonetes bacterium]|nr:hypothetical protein [Candidatus Cloacimonadota bacterium]
MKKFEAYNLIDINKKKGFPRTYRFNQFVRWLVILLSLFAITYAVYYIFTGIDADSSTIHKIVPFVIIFLAIHSLLRNLFSLNSIRFKSEGIEFRYIANRSVFIRWEDIKRLALYQGKTRAIKLTYQLNEREKELIFTMVFPNMLEIINSIAEMCPHLAVDEFMRNVTLTEEERAEAREKEERQE